MARKIGPLSGFPELLPSARFVERHVIESLTRTFELHGFANVATRAVEPVDQLLGKGETSKEIYLLRRLHETSEDGHAGMGLHFDLTVPFARYVVEHAGHLEFPFRRFQIQPVWRGERPQEGRYREFVQADIDIVGRDTLASHHDAEVIATMAAALRELDFLPGFTMRVNNRKVLTGAYVAFGIGDPEATMRVVDKLDKIGPGKVAELLVSESGCQPEQASRAVRLAEVSGTDPSTVVAAVREICPEGNATLDEGLDELSRVLSDARAAAGGGVEVRADLSIARGLDYYTGTVVETTLAGYEQLGSICSGGRYDALATDGRTTYPGVGVSFGVTRALVPLLAAGVVGADRSVPSTVLVAVADESSRSASDDVARALRARGVPCETAPSAAKFGKQIKAAEKRGIPFVWFPGEADHQVKDIRSGEQVAADPATWSPPARDLRPQVTVRPSPEETS